GGRVRLLGADNETRLTMSGGGSVAIQLGGLILGAGQVGGPLVNNGFVSPGIDPAPGTLTVAGSYTQSATGVLSTPLTAFGASKLAITGAATLGGTYGAAGIAGFVPASGTTFTTM